ncbi:unnamed protein product [Dicrocoelium dendriticum]|nr:unnamed protein product [Dicrocoelium dendriticum]
MRQQGSPPRNGWKPIDRHVNLWNGLSQPKYPSASTQHPSSQAKTTPADDSLRMMQSTASCLPTSPTNPYQQSAVAADPPHHVSSSKDRWVEKTTAFAATRSSGPSPIYEGMEYWHVLDNADTTQWTRVPIRLSPTVNNSTYASKPSLSLGKQMDGSRCHPTTRLQLTGTRPPLPFSAITSQWSQRDQTTVGNSQGSATVRTRADVTARRASTVSPVRRKPDAPVAEEPQRNQMTQTPESVVNRSINAAGGDGVCRLCASTICTDERREGVPDKPYSSIYSEECPGALGVQSDHFRNLTVAATCEQSHQPLRLSDTERLNRINIRIPSQRKFLLDRVASNDDICIETETPFAFSIAATDDKVCITKESSAINLSQSVSMGHQGNIGRRIPVSLRLTFGSETDLVAKDDGELNLTQGEPYRSTYHIDLPITKVNQLSRVVLRKNPTNPDNPLRYSLPCIPFRGEEIAMTEPVS